MNQGCQSSSIYRTGKQSYLAGNMHYLLREEQEMSGLSPQFNRTGPLPQFQGARKPKGQGCRATPHEEKKNHQAKEDCF